MRGAERDRQMTEEEMIAVAEANISADYREKKITKERFQMEMLIVARSRFQANKEAT